MGINWVRYVVKPRSLFDKSNLSLESTATQSKCRANGGLEYCSLRIAEESISNQIKYRDKLDAKCTKVLQII